MEASILILCWNHEKYIKQCLESIFVQTNKDLEILFLDNTSSDNSFHKAKAILEGSGFTYQIYRNEAPKSVTKNFNFLLSKASGKYIFTFSADDWMAPENIDEKVTLLKSKPNVGLVFGGGWEYFEDNMFYNEVDSSKFKRGNNMANYLLLEPDSYFWAGPGYKRSVIDEVGKWDENLLMEDLDMNLRVAMKYEVDFVPKSLIYYRKHSAAYTSNYKLLIKSFRQYFQKYKKNKNLPVYQWMSNTYKGLSHSAYYNKDFSSAFNYLFNAFILYPNSDILKVAWSMLKGYLLNIRQVSSIWNVSKKLLGRQVSQN